MRAATWYLSAVGGDFEYEEVVGGVSRIQVLMSDNLSGVDFPVNSMGWTKMGSFDLSGLSFQMRSMRF